MGRIRILGAQTPAIAISVLAVALSLGGGNTLSTEVSTWVKQHGTAVKESAYSKSSTSTPTSSTNSSSLYRLDPSDVG